MNSDKPNAATVLIISIFLSFSSVAFLSGSAAADSWSDHFDGPNGTVFNPRWEVMGTDVGIQDGTTYFKAYDFDTGLNTSWHGPVIRAAIPPSGDFNITVTLYCVAVVDITLGRADVRLLDPSGAQLFAFGWEDATRTDYMSQVWLRAASDSHLMYTSGLSHDYSSFIEGGLKLSRESGITRFYVNGAEAYSGDAGRANVAYIELCLLKYGGETECVPDMKFDFISADYTPSLVPDAPADLACTPSDSSVQLTWAAPEDRGSPVLGYRVYRGTSSDGESFLTATGPAIGYLDNGLTNGQAYYYKVSAVNDVGESQLSAEASAVPVSVPGAPAGLQAVGGDAVVYLTWSPPMDNGGDAVNGYRVYRSAGGAESLVYESGSTSFCDVNVTNGIEYSYSVSAVNDVGEGAMSPVGLAVPGSALTLPGFPRNLVLTPGDGIVLVEWDPPESSGNTPILNYTVRRGASLSLMPVLCKLPAVTTFTDTGLANGEPYYYTVSATNSVGEGPQTEIAACTPEGPEPPDAPAGLVVNITGRQAALEWSAPTDDGGSPVTGYRIYRGTAPGDAELLAELGVALSYADSGLEWNTTYYYTVSALNAAGEGPRSYVASATTDVADEGNETVIPPPPSWTDNFALTSAIATIISLVAGLAIAYMFMWRGGGDAPSAANGPDEPVEDETEDDGAHEEEEDK